MTEPTPTPTPTPAPPKVDEPPTEKTFTQAELDSIVKERVKRVKDGFADYEELKAKAGTATTLEERVAQIEKQATDNEARAMRAEVANAKGLTPSQAKRLVGTTREELEADADELLADIGAQKQQGNHVPNEGNNPPAGDGGELRDFTRKLFDVAD